MKKVVIFIMFLFLLFFLLLQSFSQSQSNVDNNWDLAKEIRSIIDDESINEIRLKSLTNFDWDKAFIFTPYTSYGDIEETLGTKFKGSIDQFMGEYYLLVFLNDNKVVQYAELSYRACSKSHKIRKKK